MKLIAIITCAVLLVSIVTIIIVLAKKRPGTSMSNLPVTSQPIVLAQKNDAWPGLRDLIFHLKPEEMGVQSGSSDTYGFVMEMGNPNQNTKVTVVAFRDGTMSLYLSNGGGVLGSGQRSPEAAKIATGVVIAAKDFTSKLQKTETFPVPETGRVRFFVLTGEGVYTAEAELTSVVKEQDPLFPLFAGGQNILTQIRLTSQSTSAGK